MVELKDIVRQKDVAFAGLLNRIQTCSKDTALLTADVETLKSRETGEQSSALHIFPTNAQVWDHNLEQLHRVCLDIVKINAQDYVNNPKTNKLELKRGEHAVTYNTCLPAHLSLGQGA